MLWRRHGFCPLMWLALIQYLVKSRMVLLFSEMRYHVAGSQSEALAKASERRICHVLRVRQAWSVWVGIKESLARPVEVRQGQSPNHSGLLKPFSPTLLLLVARRVYQSVQDHTGLTHPIVNFWHLGTLALRTERQSAKMSKIKNGWLDR